MAHRIVPFVIDHTGEIVGGAAGQPCEVTLHGWAFENSATAGTIKFYVPAAVANGRTPLAPSASGTLLMTIDLAATPTSNPFSINGGWYFKDGLYAITSATTITGTLFIS